MLKFVNPQKSTVQNDAVTQLSDTGRFVASGSAKGSILDKSSWVAEFVGKSPSNTFFNPHIAYISFFSDREMVYSEFANVADVNNNYAFFESVVRQKLSPSTFEFTKQQYTIINRRGAESDSIEYVNISDLRKFTTDDPTVTFHYFYDFWKAPAYTALGYRVIMSANIDTDWDWNMVNYNKYFWTFPWFAQDELQINRSTVNADTDANTEANMGANMSNEIFNHNIDVSETSLFVPTRRMLDIKVDVANNKFFYNPLSEQWIVYYNDTQHYSDQKYVPYYGIVNYYRTKPSDPSTWISIHPLLNGDVTIDDNNFGQYLQFNEITNSSAGGIPILRTADSGDKVHVWAPGSEYQGGQILFFPEIIRNYSFEPAKIITKWPYIGITDSGGGYSNPV